MYALHDLGRHSHTIEFEPHAAGGLTPARVAAQHRGAYVLFSELGELRADTAGRVSHQANGAGDLPAVGDRVAVVARADEGAATIQHVFARPRSSRARSRSTPPRSRHWRRTSTPLHRHVAQRGLQPPPARALHHDGAGERCSSRDCAHQDRPLSRLGPPPRPRSRRSPMGSCSCDLEHLREGLDRVRAHLSPGRTIALLKLIRRSGKSRPVDTFAGEALAATRRSARTTAQGTSSDDDRPPRRSRRADWSGHTRNAGSCAWESSDWYHQMFWTSRTSPHSAASPTARPDRAGLCRAGGDRGRYAAVPTVGELQEAAAGTRAPRAPARQAPPGRGAKALGSRPAPSAARTCARRDAAEGPISRRGSCLPAGRPPGDRPSRSPRRPCRTRSGTVKSQPVSASESATAAGNGVPSTRL